MSLDGPVVVVFVERQGLYLLVHRSLTSLVVPGPVGGLQRIHQCCGRAVALSAASVANGSCELDVDPRLPAASAFAIAAAFAI